MNIKTFLIATLISVVLLTMVFTPISIQQSVSDYDPWCDINDDGKIDIKDVATVAKKYGTTGTPINKTALLLELQSRVDALETRIPRKGCITIGPAALTGEDDSTTHYITYGCVGLMGFGYFYADVQLPNASNVVKMTVALMDLSSTRYLSIELWRQNFIDPPEMIANVTTLPPERTVSDLLYDDTIDYATVDTRYMYFLWVYISGYGGAPIDNPTYVWTAIEYEYPA